MHLKKGALTNYCLQLPYVVSSDFWQYKVEVVLISIDDEIYISDEP